MWSIVGRSAWSRCRPGPTKCPMTKPPTQRIAARQEGGLYPIDALGVLLPTADFSRVEARTYPPLSEIRTLPLGPVGENWGDPRVGGGAELAAVLFEDWQRLRLYRIVPSEHPRAGRTDERI